MQPTLYVVPQKRKPFFVAPCRTLDGLCPQGTGCKCFPPPATAPSKKKSQPKKGSQAQQPVEQFSSEPRKEEKFWKSEYTQFLLSQLDIQGRWLSNVETLANMNRFCRFPGILEARDFIFQKLSALPGMKVSLQEFVLRPDSGYPKCAAFNVVGRLYGSETPDKIIVIGGHYDSIAFDGDIAPGAVDNASGAAGVLELAHIFSLNPPKVTMEFVFFSAEEIGYLGSKHHVKEFKETIYFMLNLDMIAWGARPEGNVIDLETSKRNEHFAKVWARAGAHHCSQPVSVSLSPWGSDHVSYLNAGVPAMLTTNVDCASYLDYHSTRDKFQNVDPEIAKDILSLNLICLSYLENSKIPRRVYEIPEKKKIHFRLEIVTGPETEEVEKGVCLISKDVISWGRIEVENFFFGQMKVVVHGSYVEGSVDGFVEIIKAIEEISEDVGDIQVLFDGQ